MACDNTQGNPVIQGRKSWVRERHPNLFDGELENLPCGYAVHHTPEEGREEGSPKGILNWKKGDPCYRGNILDKGPLLLEGLL